MKSIKNKKRITKIIFGIIKKLVQINIGKGNICYLSMELAVFKFRKTWDKTKLISKETGRDE